MQIDNTAGDERDLNQAEPRGAMTFTSWVWNPAVPATAASAAGKCFQSSSARAAPAENRHAKSPLKSFRAGKETACWGTQCRAADPCLPAARCESGTGRPARLQRETRFCL